ncbi:hypothetical protein COLO4_02364, partial [Corchorus olitorius]
ALQPRGGAQLIGEQLADPPEPGLAPGEFQVQLPATLAHGSVGYLVCQRQWLLKPVAIECEGVVHGIEVQRASEGLPVLLAIVRLTMGETSGEQRQGLAQQVIADHLQRNQAELCIERRQFRLLAVIAGAEPDAFAFLDQAQAEKCSQQRGVAQRQAQSVTQSGTGQQGITEHAVGRNMHAPPELQADIPAPGHRIGAHLHFLARGDARVGTAKVGSADAAALEQGFVAEGLHDQGYRVQGGQVGVQHARLPGWWTVRKTSNLHAFTLGPVPSGGALPRTTGRCPATIAACRKPLRGSARHPIARRPGAGGCRPHRYPTRHRLHGIG